MFIVVNPVSGRALDLLHGSQIPPLVFPFFETRVLLLSSEQVSCFHNVQPVPCSSSTLHAAASGAEQTLQKQRRCFTEKTTVEILRGKKQKTHSAEKQNAAELLLGKRGCQFQKSYLIKKNIYSFLKKFS